MRVIRRVQAVRIARCFRDVAHSQTAAEDAELVKDREALRSYIMIGIGTVTVVSSLYFAVPWARKQYFPDEGTNRLSVRTWGKPSLGGPFTLVATNGEPVSQSSYLGSWCFFYFGFTHCPEICPVELNRMSHVVNEVRKAKPGIKIAPLFVSCDPRRDSLAAIKEYLSAFHQDFIGLVGTPKQVDDTCKSYRIYYSLPDDSVANSGDYLIDHSIAIFLFDPKGNFVDFFGNRYNEHEITDKVLGYIGQFEKDPLWTNY